MLKNHNYTGTAELKGHRIDGSRPRMQFRGGYSGKRGSDTGYRNRYHANDKRNNGHARYSNQTSRQQEMDRGDKNGETERHLNH